MRIRGWAVTGLGLLVPLLAACGPSATTAGSAYGSGSTSASPMTSASSGSAASMGASGTSAGMTRTVTLTIKTTQIGKVLADAKGDTLYWYSKDMRNGPSTCTGGCLSAWPVVAGKPAAAMGIAFAGKLGEVTDAGGTVQATYNGYPLYTYSGDMAPGETAGNGVGGVWHVISGQYLTTMSSGSGSIRLVRLGVVWFWVRLGLRFRLQDIRLSRQFGHGQQELHVHRQHRLLRRQGLYERFRLHQRHGLNRELRLESRPQPRPRPDLLDQRWRLRFRRLLVRTFTVT